MWETYKEGNLVTGKIGNLKKGGYFFVTDEGCEGFLPESQVDYKRPGTLEMRQKYIGQVVQCTILTLDAARRRFVVGRRALIEQERDGQVAAFWAKLNVGDRLNGKVIKIMDYGIFLNLHETLSDRRLNGLLHQDVLPKPASSYELGEVVQVNIVELNHEIQRIKVGYDGYSLAECADDSCRQ